jgi:hypothetical protein
MKDKADVLGAPIANDPIRIDVSLKKSAGEY